MPVNRDDISHTASYFYDEYFITSESTRLPTHRSAGSRTTAAAAVTGSWEGVSSLELSDRIRAVQDQLDALGPPQPTPVSRGDYTNPMFASLPPPPPAMSAHEVMARERSIRARQQQLREEYERRRNLWPWPSEHYPDIHYLSTTSTITPENTMTTSFATTASSQLYAPAKGRLSFVLDTNNSTLVVCVGQRAHIRFAVNYTWEPTGPADARPDTVRAFNVRTSFYSEWPSAQLRRDVYPQYNQDMLALTDPKEQIREFAQLRRVVGASLVQWRSVARTSSAIGSMRRLGQTIHDNLTAEQRRRQLDEQARMYKKYKNAREALADTIAEIRRDMRESTLDSPESLARDYDLLSCVNEVLETGTRLMVWDHPNIETATTELDARREALLEGMRRALGMDHQVITPAGCGHMDYSDRVHYLNGSRTTACSGCEEDEVMTCIDDGRRYFRSELYYWDSDDEYHLNPEPDPDDDDYYPPSDTNADRLLSYSTNTMHILTKDDSFETSPTGDFHLGVELETVNNDECLDARIAAVREELGAEYLIAKSDGSLPSNGIEFVTRPTSLKTHLAKFGSWGRSRSGLTAWRHNSCGMHVHIDSKAFTALTLGKMLQFYNNRDNAQLIRSVAGRHPDTDNQARTYAGFDCSQDATETPTKALKGKSGGSRYVMVNLTNLTAGEARRLNTTERGGGRYNTVEVRVFRASLLRERLLAQLEFVHAVVVFCRSASHRMLGTEQFKDWLKKNHPSYPNLARWLELMPVKHGAPQREPEASDRAAEASL